MPANWEVTWHCGPITEMHVFVADTMAIDCGILVLSLKEDATGSTPIARFNADEWISCIRVGENDPNMPVGGGPIISTSDRERKLAEQEEPLATILIAPKDVKDPTKP